MPKRDREVVLVSLTTRVQLTYDLLMVPASIII